MVWVMTRWVNAPMGSRRGKPEQDKSRKGRITQGTLARNKTQLRERKRKNDKRDSLPPRSRTKELREQRKRQISRFFFFFLLSSHPSSIFGRAALRHSHNLMDFPLDDSFASNRKTPPSPLLSQPLPNGPFGRKLPQRKRAI